MATNKVSKETKAKRGATGPSVRRAGTEKVTAKGIVKKVYNAAPTTRVGRAMGKAAAKRTNEKRKGKK